MFWNKLKFEKQTIKICGICIAIISIVVILFFQIPRWYNRYDFRTRFVENQVGIVPISEESAKKVSEGKCDEFRKNAARQYLPREIPAVVSALKEEKIILVGEEADNSEPSGSVIIDTAGKNISLLCFDFSGRVVVTGGGKIEISYSNFRDVSGNAISVSSGSGKIFGNMIENSKRSGIFIDSGDWEVENNIIKNNGSYGVYGGYGAELNLRENHISNNGGYEIRLMKERKVYE